MNAPQWMTVEALAYPEAPMTVVTKGPEMTEFSSASRALPPRTLALLDEMFSAATPEGEIPVCLEGKSARTLVWPILGPDHIVHGFTVWIGSLDEEPVDRPPSAGYTWELARFGMRPTPECAALSGSPFQEFSPVADFYSNGAWFNKHEELVTFLTMTGDPQRGHKFIAPSSTYHRTRGDIIAVVLAYRVAGPGVINCLIVDLTPVGRAPTLPGPELAGALSALESADRHLAMIAFTIQHGVPEMVLGRWFTTPPQWVRYDNALDNGWKSYLHEDDRKRFAQRWSDGESILGEDVVRFAGFGSDWIEARVRLRPHTGGDGRVVPGLFVMELLGRVNPEEVQERAPYRVTFDAY